MPPQRLCNAHLSNIPSQRLEGMLTCEDYVVQACPAVRPVHCISTAVRICILSIHSCHLEAVYNFCLTSLGQPATVILSWLTTGWTFQTIRPVRYIRRELSVQMTYSGNTLGDHFSFTPPLPLGHHPPSFQT